MNKDVWRVCHGGQHIQPLRKTAWRIVEAQHILSTRKLVDSIDEHEILEDLIESVKPAFINIKQKEFLGYHFLLSTPFRYPPLKYGSRFGRCTERALWYGSEKYITAMAEKAFYQSQFLQASQAEFGIINLTLTAFSVPIKTLYGIDLMQSFFSSYTKKISSPQDYQHSQLLGTAMREAGVAAFYYQSARDPQQGVNIGVFTPDAFADKQPDSASFQTWLCNVNKHSIEFLRTSALESEVISFTVSSICVQL